MMIALVAINFSQAATVDSTKASKSADTTMLNVGVQENYKPYSATRNGKIFTK